MGNYSQKLYADNECPEKVTVRVLPEKKMVYPRFRDLVTKEIGSDVCFVTTALWEAFTTAMDKGVPSDTENIEIKFMRQNVQINIGCDILYAPKRARRYPRATWFPPPAQAPQMKDKTEVNKNRFFPLLMEEWGSLGEKQKLFWRERLIESGIMPKPRKRKARSPSISTGTTGKRKPQPRQKRVSHAQSMTNVGKTMIIKGGWFGGLKRAARKIRKWLG